MALSQIFGMKMRNLLFGVIFGLLAVVHSTPVNTAILDPAKTDEEDVREAVMSTASPKRNTTLQASQQLPSESKESDLIEALSYTSTALPTDTVRGSSDSSPTQSPVSSTTFSTVPYEGQPNVTPDHISVSQTTDPAVSTSDYQSSDVGMTSTSMASSISTSFIEGSGFEMVNPTEETSSMTSISTASSTSMSSFIEGSGFEMVNPTEETSSMTSTSTASSTSVSSIIRIEGSGSGFEMVDPTEETPSMTSTSTASSTSMSPSLGFGVEDTTKETFSVMSSSNTQTSTTSSTSTAESEGLIGQDTAESSFIQPSNALPIKPESPASHKGHSTPGWIIIVGFIVGVAALVMLCVAIATRDKWNGPNQASQQETKTNSSNQQRELEMETFLHKDNPRENGKAAEYTVIPLDELPEKYSSH